MKFAGPYQIVSTAGATELPPYLPCTNGVRIVVMNWWMGVGTPTSLPIRTTILTPFVNGREGTLVAPAVDTIW